MLLGGGSMMGAKFVRAGLPFDVLRDFAPVSLLATVQTCLLVNPTVPARTVKEFIALARAHPGKLNFGSGGVGQTNYLAMTYFSAETGEMIGIEGERHWRLGFARTFGDQGVIGAAAGDLLPADALEQPAVAFAVKRHNARTVKEIPFEQGERIGGREPVRSGKSGQDRVSLEKRVRRSRQPLARAKSALDFRGGAQVMCVPRT